MGRIVVTEFVSLDGVMEDPGGAEELEHGGWSFEFSRGVEGDRFKLDETLASDALLLGRRTHEGFAAAWPSREGEFADKSNSMPKYVVLLDARSTDVDEHDGAERPSSRGGHPAPVEAPPTSWFTAARRSSRRCSTPTSSTSSG